MLVAGPRLDALVDDEQLVQLFSAGVVPREGRVGPEVDVEMAGDDQRVTDREVVQAESVEKLNRPREQLAAEADVPTADFAVHLHPSQHRVVQTVMADYVVPEGHLGNHLEAVPVRVEHRTELVLVVETPLGLRQRRRGHKEREREGEDSHAGPGAI